MAIVASNGLTGTDGVQPTLATLGSTGDAPTSLNNTGMLYSDDVQMRGRNSVLLRTALRRQDASQFAWTMPAGAWTLRFYVRSPPLSDPGDFDIAERRLLIEFDTQGLMWRESSGRNTVSRLQALTLESSNIPGTETGQAQAFDQLLRYEVMYDGVSDLTVRVYAGDDTVSYRQNVWSHTPGGSTLTISGYRWYNHDLLQSGDTDATTDGQVTIVQNQILVWDPNALPNFGADGDYGAETVTAVENFQADIGLTVDGVAGAETRTALALYERLDADPNDYPDPVWVGNMTLTDTAEWIGPLDLVETTVDAPIEFDTGVVAEDTSQAAHAFVEFDAQASGITKAASADADAPVELGTSTTPSKKTSVTSQAGAEFGVDVVHSATSFIPDPPDYPVQFEMYVYDPNGSLRGTLHHALSWSASVPMNDVGSMTLTVSAHAPDAHLLEPPFEIALRLRPAEETTFIEPPGCRFISLRRQRDYADRSGVYTWTLGNFAWVLRKAKVRTSLVTQLERSYTDRSVGWIMDDLISASQAGPFGGLLHSFTDTQDSDGQSWTDSQTIDLSHGTDLFSILREWTDERIVDWRFQGRTWQMYRADEGMAGNVGISPPLSPNAGCLEATEMLSFEDYANQVFYIQPGIPEQQRARTGVSGTGSNPDYGSMWGVWQDSITIPGVTDQNVAAAMAVARRNQVHAIVPQMSFRIPLIKGTSVPLYHYQPGQSVRVEAKAEEDTGPDTERSVRWAQVKQVALTNNGQRVCEAVITLDHRFPTRDVKATSYYRTTAAGADAVRGNRGTIPFW